MTKCEVENCENDAFYGYPISGKWNRRQCCIIHKKYGMKKYPNRGNLYRHINETFRQDPEWINNIPTHKYVCNGETRFTAFCLCGGKLDKEDDYFYEQCNKYKSRNMVMYNGKRLCVCKDCFRDKQHILKEQFKEKFTWHY